MIYSPWKHSEISEFFESYFYKPEAFLIHEILSADIETGQIVAKCRANTSWLIAPFQREKVPYHPLHISGGDLVMLTASLGSLHAYFFHQCKWKNGWVGFGSRMEKVEFHNLAHVTQELDLYSSELKVRRGSKRTLITFSFRFEQNKKVIYTSQQTALFVKAC